MTDWTVEQSSNIVTKLRSEVKRNSDWEFKILLTADRHIDSPKSDLNKQKKHLETARLNGWPVIDIGDLFDAMQGKFDPRRSRKELLNKLNEKEEYVDALVEYGHDFLKDYKDSFAMFGLGNHEISISKKNESDLLKRLVHMLNQDGSQVVLGGYQGWIKILFQENGVCRNSINIRYTHGAGGDAPVTKGVINANRRAVLYPDAQIVISGHNHYQWMFPLDRIRLSERGYEYKDEQLHLQVPSYKDEITNQSEGFAVESQHQPKPLGGWWLYFWWNPTEKKIEYDAYRAK